MARDPVADLRRVAYLLERAQEPTYRVRAFRTAAAAVAALDATELERRRSQGTLTELAGVGKVTAAVVAEAMSGVVPAYLARLQQQPAPPPSALRAALRGDLHTHSDWSDGGSPVEEMATAARELGHDYLALTDHSPRLTVARGLSPERLRHQLRVVGELNERLAPFRVLTGIEVDILEDGSLDQEPALLAELDVVVGSVHSLLRMPREDMTRRMVTAVANPHLDVLGHCTGRLVAGRGRPESQFDAEVVFEACRRFGVAVEVNARPERLDPPRRLLRLAADTGCDVAIDTDAHAPGQLEWQENGCSRATECGIGPERVLNTMTLDALLARLAQRG